MKNQYNGLNPEDQPGPLEPFLGARVEQFYALNYNVPLSGFFGSGQANIWAEQLTVTAKNPDADHIEVLERYGKSNGWLDGQPAIVTRRYGTGSITYVGAWLNPPLMERLAAWALHSAGVSPILPNVPMGVEVCQRSNAAKDIIILINHDTTPHTIQLRRPMFNLLKNQSVRVTSVTLPKYGVAVLEASPQ